MDLRAELDAVAQEPERDRRALYRALLTAQLYVRAPAAAMYAVAQPETGLRSVPAFLTADEAIWFWSMVIKGKDHEAEPTSLRELATGAARVGGLVLDPAGAAVVVDRADLLQLAAGEVPGELTAWLRDLGRLGREPSEIIGRLRRSHVHVITGKGPDQEPRLYLLERSEDGTLAVPCFSSRETLLQFVQVRRLFEGHHDDAVSLVDGAYCLRAASGMGAYVLIDPESPWETQLEPTLL